VQLDRFRTAVVIVQSDDHHMPGHPESPDRFRYFSRFKDGPMGKELVFLEPLELKISDLESVHSRGYLSNLQQAVEHGPGLLDFGDTYVTQASLKAALQSAGAALAIVDFALDHEHGRGFSLARPPGHHATASRGMGFCLINNIALAAQHALDRGLERVMIVDFDVHHGNGTQDIFYDQAQVLYLSTHQGGIYPGTGAIQEVGLGPGEGATINIPLPARTGDMGFSSIFSRVIAPAAHKFEPELLLVSAGYDAHWQDPLARLQLTSAGYQMLSDNLVSLADELCSGRVVFVLEGGYDPKALFDGVEAALSAMTGHTSPKKEEHDLNSQAEPDIEAIIQAVEQTHGLG
jgi:acetoin utilization deacetylase AcuC-like enzyme